jgi:hypothetical protein
MPCFRRPTGHRRRRVRKRWPRSLTYFDDPAKAYCNISTYFSCSMTPPDAGKTFLVTWDGSGDLDIFNGANVVKDLANRRITFTLQGDNSSLRITKTDSADYVRNIKMIRADRAALAASGEPSQVPRHRGLRPRQPVLVGQLRPQHAVSFDPRPRGAR